MTSIEPAARPLALPPGAPARSADARDRASIRERNERIAARQPSRMFIEFACECLRTGCAASVALGSDEYERLRRFPGRFAVAPGHEAPGHERVVELDARYAVVEQH
jgi:hypothetical protein